MRTVSVTAVLGLLLSLCLLTTTAGCGGSQADTQTTPVTDDQAAAEEAAQPLGIELGEFELREYHPVEGTRSTLEFTLVASVQVDAAERMQQLLEHRRFKVRDHVMTAVRVAPLEELDDPELASLRRRIELRLRRFLPELPIDDVLVTDFDLAIDK